MGNSVKKSVYRAKAISDEILMQLSQKYGVAVDRLKAMAKEMNIGRPKLEMHLIYLKTLARKR